MPTNTCTTFAAKAAILILSFNGLLSSCRSSRESATAYRFAHAADSTAATTISDCSIDITDSMTARIDEWIFASPTDDARHKPKAKLYRRTTITKIGNATATRNDSTSTGKESTYDTGESLQKTAQTEPHRKPTLRILAILALIATIAIFTIRHKIKR